MKLNRRHGILAGVMIVGLTAFGLTTQSIDSHVKTPVRTAAGGIHDVDSYPGVSCLIPRPKFDGKLLYDCAFQSIMRKSYKLRDVKEREAWAKEWEHKHDNDHALDTEESADKAVGEMFASLGERFNYYKDAAATKASNETMRGSFGGMGAELTLKVVDEKAIVPGSKIVLSSNVRLQVVEPYENNPAAKAGVQKDDFITHIDGKSVNGMTMDEAVSKIKGDIGTKVNLTLERAGKPVDVEITRDEVVLKMVVDAKYLSNDIFYFRIKQFASRYFAKEVADALDQGKNAKAIVLDLRNNPGGLLDDADVLAQFMMHDGTYLVRKERDGTKMNTDDAILREDFAIQRDGNKYVMTPRTAPRVKEGTVVIILMNEHSASASEIIAGTLQANGIATVVGNDSHGKGVGQSVMPLPFGRSAAIISFEFYPGNRTIDWRGVTADVQVDGTSNPKEFGNVDKDNQLKVAIETANKKIAEKEAREKHQQEVLDRRHKEFDDYLKKSQQTTTP